MNKHNVTKIKYFFSKTNFKSCYYKRRTTFYQISHKYQKRFKGRLYKNRWQVELL